LSYTLAARAIANLELDLDDRLVTALDKDDLVDTLAWLRCAAARLGAARARRGGLDARRVDPELAYDLDGTPVPLHEQGRPPKEATDEGPAHEMIERLMVAANEAVAAWLADRGLPGVFRVHEAPDAASAAEIDQFCTQLGFYTGLGPAVTPLALAALDHQLAMAPTDAASRTFELMLGRMPRATYTTEPGPHFGLGSTAYLHFTSPIRRYADVCVHKVVKAYLAGTRDFDELRGDIASVVGHLNESTARAARAEGQLRRSLWMVVIADAIHQDRNKVFTARVTSVDDKGVRAVLDGTAVWGRLAFADLPGRWDRTGPGAARSDKGDSLTIGESMTVTVADVDPVACVLNLAPTRSSYRPSRRR
jgi:ribonuclease R